MIEKRRKQDIWLTQDQFDALSSLEVGAEYHITDAKIDYTTDISNLPTLGTAAAKDSGTANGVASLDENGLVPTSELPIQIGIARL